MKTTIRLLGIIAFAIIGFLFAACPIDQPETHTHEWGDWTVTLASTCSMPGTRERLCSLDAGHKETQAIAINASAHDWDMVASNIITAPTCTNEGEGTLVCKHNGTHTKSGAIDPLGHDAGAWHTTLEADCETVGTKELRCTRDNFVLDRGVIAALGHDWNETISNIITAPTCTDEGQGTFVCKHNGTHTKNGTIDPLGHDAGAWHTTLEADCETVGTKELRCTRDDFVLDNGVIAALGHDWNETISNIITAPTCTDEGEGTLVCNRDGTHTSSCTIAIDPLAHDWEWKTTTNPTLVKGGEETEICKNDSSHTKETRAVSSLPITTTTEWTSALALISNGGNNQNYDLRILGNIDVEGNPNTSWTFGTGLSITVTLKGSGKLKITSNGCLMNVGIAQTLIIDSSNLTLEGFSNNSYPIIRAFGSGTNVVLKFGTIKGNTNSGQGGGVYILSGTFTMEGGRIEDNTALDGGGVMIGTSGNFLWTGGSITTNAATQNGGGVYVLGKFSKSAGFGLIAGNDVGIYNNNTAGGYGHAINYFNFSIGSFYRDTTINGNEIISTDSALPATVGETLNGWTKRN